MTRLLEPEMMLLVSRRVNLNWGFLALPDVNIVSTVCSVLYRGPIMKKIVVVLGQDSNPGSRVG